MHSTFLWIHRLTILTGVLFLSLSLGWKGKIKPTTTGLSVWFKINIILCVEKRISVTENVYLCHREHWVTISKTYPSNVAIYGFPSHLLCKVKIACVRELAFYSSSSLSVIDLHEHSGSKGVSDMLIRPFWFWFSVMMCGNVKEKNKSLSWDDTVAEKNRDVMREIKY